MIAGYDKRGPAIFKVDSEGQRVQLKLCSIGSGSLRCVLHIFELLKPSSSLIHRQGVFFSEFINLKSEGIYAKYFSAYGVLDNFYQLKMTDDEAYKLARRAIMHATYRDIGSGGVCNS